MPEFRLHTVESAPAASRTLLRGLQQQVGFVPNLAATMAESPALLETFLATRSAAATGSLDPVAREVVAITTGIETGCRYCVAAHSMFALKNGASPAVVEAARSATAIADPRLEALARFTRAVVRRQDDVASLAEDLARAGLTPAGVFDVLAAIAVPMLASSVAQVAAVDLDGAFQPQAWTRQS